MRLLVNRPGGHERNTAPRRSALSKTDDPGPLPANLRKADVRVASFILAINVFERRARRLATPVPLTECIAHRECLRQAHRRGE